MQEQEYKIEWMEKKTTSTGKEKADCSLKAGTETVENVTIWADFPDFANLMPGSTVKGTLTPAKDPRYGPTLYPPKSPKQAAGANFKQKMIDDTMTRKEGSIEKFQNSKEENIKLSAAERDAVMIVTTFYKDRFTTDLDEVMEDMVKQKIVMWRDWFLSDKFTDVAPF